MTLEKTYSFIKEDYNQDGFNKTNGQLFLNFIAECENDFHEDLAVFIANCLFANSSTMYLMKCCYVTEEYDDFGMDLIDGEINMDVNLDIEKHSKRKTTYAIESRVKGNEGEPLFLIIDENIKDGEFILKYIPDDDEEDDVNLNVPKPIESKIIYNYK